MKLLLPVKNLVCYHDRNTKFYCRQSLKSRFYIASSNLFQLGVPQTLDNSILGAFEIKFELLLFLNGLVHEPKDVIRIPVGAAALNLCYEIYLIS